MRLLRPGVVSEVRLQAAASASLALALRRENIQKGGMADPPRNIPLRAANPATQPGRPTLALQKELRLK